MTFDIAFIGHYTKDTIVYPTATRVVDGGAFNYGANVAARMGLRVAVVTRLAREDWHVVEALEALGVTAFATATPQSTGLRLTYPTDNLDQRTIELSSSAGPFTPEEIAPLEARAYAVGASVRGEVPTEVVQALAAKGGILAVDVQGFLRIVRNGALVSDGWPGKEDILRHVTVLKTDAVEAELITGESDRHAAAKALAAFGPKEVLLTTAAGCSCTTAVPSTRHRGRPRRSGGAAAAATRAHPPTSPGACRPRPRTPWCGPPPLPASSSKRKAPSAAPCKTSKRCTADCTATADGRRPDTTGGPSNQSQYAKATEMTAHTGQPHTRNTLLLKAPLSGYLVPLERVPDPVFAQKMVGDGISIDPVSQRLLSPCNGTVAQVHSAGHAVTIAAAGGVDVMIHIGLDTVQLKGRGFTPTVKAGEVVATGALLIEFDADFIATHAKSLLTQVVVTTMDRVAALAPRSGSVTAGSDAILELTLADATTEAQPAAGGTATSDAIVVPNVTGLHARPAAVLANLAKKFKADIRLRRGDDLANAKSVVSIMGLEIGYGDKVNLVARGPDADEAIAALARALTRGLGDEGTAPAPAPASVMVSDVAAPAPRPRSTDPSVLLGVAASPGLAVGTVFQVRHEEIVFPEDAEDPYRERRRLDDAIEQAKLELEALQARLKGEANPGKAAIFAAHQELLDDPGLTEIAVSAIAKGRSAPFAWRRAFRAHAEYLATLKNELLAARANDVRDVGERVLRLLTGAEAEQPELPAQTILIAEDLTPSDIASLDRTRVVGFCTTAGGASSHVAILARSLDITAVAGIDPAALDVPKGATVILDGGKGTLRLNPSADEVARIRRLQERQAAKRKADLETASQPAVTGDGHRVEVAANIGGLADAEQAVRLGAEGVGLLRSEFLFMGRAVAPTEEEQAAAYSAIAAALGPERPLVIRTLDVGGDKPLPYLPIPKENNPFLGERGIRVGLDRPEILRTQVRAILRASQAGKVLAMFPMIATLSEWRAARALLEEEREKLGIPPIPVGIMVEVPAAAILAEQFAREADFFSIGTNDLTQYTLAMDRGHPKLAPQVDGLHPALLHLIAGVVEAAHRERKWVGVCGGIAGDLQAIPFLIGLGVDELSVSVPTIPSIKAEVRALRAAECRRLAQEALRQDTAADVRALCPSSTDDDGSATASPDNALRREQP